MPDIENFKIYDFTKQALEEIFEINNIQSDKIDYIYDYFNNLKIEKKYPCISIIHETDYIDKFYLRDYSKWYSQLFEKSDSHSSRIHFFSCKIDDEEFKKILKTGKHKTLLIDKKCETNETDPYLGHITIKPVRDTNNTKLIGRTALSVYPDIKGNDKRNYIKVPNHCSLFGIDLEIESMPFHEQDIAVGACASACLWMTQFLINDWYSIPILSLSEITEMSRLLSPVSTPSPTFPSAGLTIAEMANYLERMDLRYHVFDLKELILLKNVLKDDFGINVSLDEMFEDILNAYFTTRFPIICGISLYKNDLNNKDKFVGAHAVLLTGYKVDSDDNIIGLYLHDDQIGPYCRTTFAGSFFHWENKWTDSPKIDKIILDSFLIPVDPLCKIDFLRSAPSFYKIKSNRNIIKAELNVYHISKYKNELLLKQFRDKEEILSQNMPRYVWVIHLYENDDKNISRDIVIDANRTHFRNKITEVEFQ